MLHKILYQNQQESASTSCYAWLLFYGGKIESIDNFTLSGSVRLSSNIWRNTHINLILNFEEPVLNSLSTYNSIGQGSEIISKDGMETLCLPPIKKYYSMHRYVSFVHGINCILFLKWYWRYFLSASNLEYYKKLLNRYYDSKVFIIEG